MFKCKICKATNIIKTCTINSNGLHHSFDDRPAVEDSNGTNEWYLNGKLHRLDGPAVEHYDGTKTWFLNGKRHRLDGPAYTSIDGTKLWFFEGKKAIQIKGKIRIGKQIKINGTLGLVFRKINNVFFEVVFGNQKKIVVSA